MARETAEKTRIKLKEAHTHAGRDYPEGAELSVGEITTENPNAMALQDAEWLVSIQAAEFI